MLKFIRYSTTSLFNLVLIMFVGGKPGGSTRPVLARNGETLIVAQNALIDCVVTRTNLVPVKKNSRKANGSL